MRVGSQLDVKVISTTSACKKKANVTLGGKIAAKGFQQVPHQHCDYMSVAAPAANNKTIHHVLVPMLLGGWVANIVDVKNIFLKGKFEYGEKLIFNFQKAWKRTTHQTSNHCFTAEENAIRIKKKASSNAILDIIT